MQSKGKMKLNIILGGWTNLRNLRDKVTEELFENTSLIFLDADSIEKTAEGAGRRKDSKNFKMIKC